MSLLNVRYVHTNLIAQDWKRLATFYQSVFGCNPVPPERDLRGPWLEKATGIENAQLRGIHLRLPGWGEDGPTLEIFQYGHMTDPGYRTANRPGLAHLAFAVDDVEAACQAVLAEGGGRIGEVVTLEVLDAGSVTFAYMTDPEGNLIELQSWQ
jgi:predicted enzyme related to lactoylglutathione lyase